MRSMTEAMLISLGFAVLEAKDGVEAGRFSISIGMKFIASCATWPCRA